MKNKRNTILYFRFFLLVFFISAGTTIPAQGQENDILLNKGVEAYNANRYNEAIETGIPFPNFSWEAVTSTEMG